MLLFKAARKDPTLSPVLTPSQKRIMRILGDAMRQVRATTEREEGKILDAILHGPTSRVTTLIPTEPWLEAQALIEAELAAELIAAGHRYGKQVPALRKAVVDFRFDATRPEAASWAAKHAGQLIVQIMQHQQTIVQDYVSRASMGEMAPREVAAGLRNVIGLTNEQAGWVQNFEARQLAAIEGVPTQRDLDRVANATSRYHDRVHRYRTENIARTEILSASHEGRRQAWAQGLQEGYISPTAMQEWSAEMDGRVCPICSAMDGQKVPIGEEFPQGEPPIHPSCRCDVLLLDAAPAGPWDQMSDEELDAQLESLLSGETVSTPPGVPDIQPARESVRGMPYELKPTINTKRTISLDEAAALFDDPEFFPAILKENFVKVADQDIIVNAPAKVLELIVRDKRIKNVHETQHRDPGYIRGRELTERDFGVPADAPFADRPVYGAIGNYGDADDYGAFGFVLKDGVKERATMTSGDTFNIQTPIPVRSVQDGTATLDEMTRAVPKKKIEALAFDTKQGETITDIGYSEYWEAQIHGGVSLEDVKEIRISRFHEVTPEEQSLLDQLQEMGISVVQST